VAKKRPERRIAATGPWGTVEYALSGLHQRAEAEIFVKNLPKLLGIGQGAKAGQGIGEKAERKFYELFQQLANVGYIPNPSRFSDEGGNISGIKFGISNHLIRFGCFREGNVWIVTHGFFKKGAQSGLGKWRPEDLIKAERIRVEHLSIFEK
jgi:hypothetical protein